MRNSHAKTKKASLVRLRWIYGLVCLIVMEAIFFFSAMPAKESAKVSGRITETAVRIVYPEYQKLPEQQQKGAYRLMEHIVRKSAHFFEYMILSAMVTLLLSTFPLRFHSFLAWLFTSLYAATDEWHQAFIDGRGPMLRDVLIDSAGAATGILLIVLIRFIYRKTRREDNQQG